MHRWTGFAIFLLVAGSCAPAPRAADAPGGQRAEIAAMLERSARAWNRGDLDAFVSDYLDSDRTTYIGRAGVIHGRAAIRAVYAPRFEPGGVRDSLSFEGLEVDSLAPGVINVIAQYVLSRGDSTVARGPTSLVMERADGRWYIVHDHSS
jgi:uncharacterized protein (TIGR02246 family)